MKSRLQVLKLSKETNPETNKRFTTNEIASIIGLNTPKKQGGEPMDIDSQIRTVKRLKAEASNIVQGTLYGQFPVTTKNELTTVKEQSPLSW